MWEAVRAHLDDGRGDARGLRPGERVVVALGEIGIGNATWASPMALACVAQARRDLHETTPL